MSYKIKYDVDIIKIPIHDKMKTGSKSLAIVAAAVCICLLLVSASSGIDNIKEWILPGNPKVTEAALDTLVTELRQGEPLNDAISAFCKEILVHADVPQ